MLDSKTTASRRSNPSARARSTSAPSSKAPHPGTLIAVPDGQRQFRRPRSHTHVAGLGGQTVRLGWRRGHQVDSAAADTGEPCQQGRRHLPAVEAAIEGFGRHSSSLQLTGHAKFWHPTGLTYRQKRVVVADTHPIAPSPTASGTGPHDGSGVRQSHPGHWSSREEPNGRPGPGSVSRCPRACRHGGCSLAPRDHFCLRLATAGACDHAHAYGRQGAARMVLRLAGPQLPPASFPGARTVWAISLG